MLSRVDVAWTSDKNLAAMRATYYFKIQAPMVNVSKVVSSFISKGSLELDSEGLTSLVHRVGCGETRQVLKEMRSESLINRVIVILVII